MNGKLLRRLQEAVQELRNLAHGIYPPLLMDRGLREARSAAANRSTLPTDVTVDRLQQRRNLLSQFDRVNRALDGRGVVQNFDQHHSLKHKVVLDEGGWRLGILKKNK